MAEAPSVIAPVLVCLTEGGEALAKRLAPILEAEIHGRLGRTEVEVTFEETTSHVRDLFAGGVPVIGICAAGILIRSVAPLLADKHAEPPLVALAEDGSTVVPLLGGHRGANALAMRIAEALDAHAAVTTAGDIALGIALDAPPSGWRLSNPGDAPAVMAALISGEQATITGPVPDFLEPLAGRARLLAGGSIGTVGLGVEGAGTVTYQQTSIALGVGCARQCPADELQCLAEDALAEAGIDPAAVATVVSLDLKADEPAVLALADRLDVPARFLDAETLETETPRLATPSEVVFAEVGCHGVAEGAALAAVGPAGELVLPKRKSANATVALARRPEAFVTLPGRARGKVALIGLGPGRADWRTPEASRLIAEADELVGYGFYIDLIGPLARGKARADFPLGGEEDRCRYALERAGMGLNVAVICSGDAGIYAMGALVHELLDRGDLSDAARRVDVITAPGVTAMQAAAARIGAPLGHDFCAISLSDLLTPRVDVIRRIAAAAEGDFVTALYNPVSQRRRELFVNAIATLSRLRPPTTPVVLARHLGRPKETVRIVRLDDVSVDEVDMMTVVIVGSSQSRAVQVGGTPRIYTPRGYAAKAERSAS